MDILYHRQILPKALSIVQMYRVDINRRACRRKEIMLQSGLVPEIREDCIRKIIVRVDSASIVDHKHVRDQLALSLLNPVKFTMNIPGPDASNHRVHGWIKTWYEDRGFLDAEIRYKVDCLSWNGQLVHECPLSFILTELKRTGLHAYMDSLAKDVASAIQ